MTYTNPPTFHKRHQVNDLFYGSAPDRLALHEGDKIHPQEIYKTRECHCDICAQLADDMERHNATFSKM